MNQNEPKLSVRKLRKEREFIQSLVTDEIRKTAVFRQPYYESSNVIRAARMPHNSQYIVKNIPELVFSVGYKESGQNYRTFIAKETFADIEHTIIKIFGRIVNVRTITEEEIQKAKLFFKV
ncbi:hypothetical protein RF542_05275 [Pseudomonas aeruginosa]